MNYEDLIELVKTVEKLTDSYNATITTLSILSTIFLIAIIVALVIACRAKNKADALEKRLCKRPIFKDEKLNAIYKVLEEKLSLEQNVKDKQAIQNQMDQVAQQNSAEYAMATRLIKAEQRIAELEKLVKSSNEK